MHANNAKYNHVMQNDKINLSLSPSVTLLKSEPPLPPFFSLCAIFLSPVFLYLILLLLLLLLLSSFQSLFILELEREKTTKTKPAMSEAEHAVASIWTSLASWFTPTILFCVLNLTIGTIYISSNLKSQNKQHGEDNPPQLARAPSLLERVKSINFSLYRSESYYPLQPDETHIADPATDRIPHQTPGEQGPDHHVTRSQSAGPGGNPASVPEKMKKSASEKFVSSTSEHVEEVDRRRPATVRERKGKATHGEDDEVDAKADDFINRFKQQLKLQRLDSLLRYREMLSRGSGK